MTIDPYKVLQEKYIESIPDKIADFQLCWQQLEESSWSSKKLNELKLLAHRLAGSGGSYGFPKLSQLSSDLEQLVIKFRSSNAGEEIKLEILKKLNELLAYLKGISNA